MKNNSDYPNMMLSLDSPMVSSYRPSSLSLSAWARATRHCVRVRNLASRQAGPSSIFPAYASDLY